MGLRKALEIATGGVTVVCGGIAGFLTFDGLFKGARDLAGGHKLTEMFNPLVQQAELIAYTGGPAVVAGGIWWGINRYARGAETSAAQPVSQP